MLKIKDNIDLKQMAKKYELLYCQDWSVPYEDEIYYLKWSNNNTFPVKNEIDFKNSKELFIDASVTLEELKAINKQIEELGWE